MSNIHHINVPTPPTAKEDVQHGPRKRSAYTKKATKAEVERAILSATQLGLTVYGLTIQGDKIHIQTQPMQTGDVNPKDAVNSWFDRRG